jgi:C-terminal processing protease CtpA/Prc
LKQNQNQQQQQQYFDEPHYSVVPAPRYWNTLKPAKEQQQQNEDAMGNSISATDLVSYSNIDYAAAQKMMSLSICPTNSHATQTDDDDNNEQNIFTQSPGNNLMTASYMSQQQPQQQQQPQSSVFSVRLQSNGGLLGITLAGNEDGKKPIIISGLAENGVAANTNQIQIGDTLLAINNESVIGVPLSSATKLLQVPNEFIELRLSRTQAVPNQMTNSILSINEKVPQPQALYAEVQRRPMNVVKADAISNSSSSRSGSNNSDGQLKTIHVTLYKDQVYDDYGFSVSDGLYERGVYINRVRSGGPADQVGVLKPYDRIIQVKIYKFN